MRKHIRMRQKEEGILLQQGNEQGHPLHLLRSQKNEFVKITQ